MASCNRFTTVTAFANISCRQFAALRVGKTAGNLLELHVNMDAPSVSSLHIVSMNTFAKSKLTALECVYPPISNQEAVWLQADPEVEACLRESDFYMIVGRAEARFMDVAVDSNASRLTFNLVIGENFSDAVELDINKLPGVAGFGGDSFIIEAGEKCIRIWDRPKSEDGAQVLEWFTTEKLIFDRGRGRPGVEGLERQREAATYDLLYVGIAKVGDTFDRLIANGHKARMEILANEPQRFAGARVTDETFLLMFRVEPTVTTTFDHDHAFTDADFSNELDTKAVVADAEKAYVSLAKPQYNSVMFKSYPKGKDGLYGAGFARYGYVICENLALNTAHACIQGGRDPLTHFITNAADAIFVQGDEVKHYVSGVDFPSS